MSSEKIIVHADPDLEELIPGFIDKRRNELPILKESLTKNDFPTLQSIGHKLKGNSGGYGFDHMGKIGATIEEAAKVKDSIKLDNAIKELEDYLSRLEIIYS